MLLQQKTGKRQSFSVESLAVSSRDEQERDTDSPYLSYLESKNSQATLDYNSNNVSQQWNYDARVNGLSMQDDPQPAYHLSLPQFVSTPVSGIPNHSTPFMPSAKRRRLDSTCTPPSSDDSAADDKMLIDSSSVSGVSSPEGEKQSPISTTTGSSTSDGDNESTCSDDMSRGRKKARTAFSSDQLKDLEKRYKIQKYLTASDRTTIARTLKLKEQQVKTWFQNRRMKEKRQQREEEQSRSFCLPTGGVDVAQLAAFGICPPPYQLNSPSVTNQTYNRLPSPVDMRISTLQQMSTPNNNTISQFLIPNSQCSPGVDNRLLQKMHGVNDIQGGLLNDSSMDRLASLVNTQGPYLAMPVLTGRHSVPNMGISPNSSNYRYVNHAR